MDEELPPDVRLLASMRSVGYSLTDAIADLIDNSLTAGARSIEVIGDPVAGEFLLIQDDGRGMTYNQARRALQFAGSVVESRDADDLGRFGLGLKTASLSQARKLSILTWHRGEFTALQWDIDYVLKEGRWLVKVLAPGDFAHIPEAAEFSTSGKGTMVVWENLDILLGMAADAEKRMAQVLAPLRSHLALVFHRYLEGASRRRRVAIRVNGTEVKALDPFLSGNRATQISPKDTFRINGSTIEFESFVLPHHSKLTPEESRRPDLGSEMRNWQGFYFYRADRLISWGGWHGIVRQTELTKHTRIRVDFPNYLDHLWQLDIKKSKVIPPREFLTRYRSIVERETSKSQKVQKHRGRKISTEQGYVPLWDLVANRDGSVQCQINRDHPAVSSLLARSGSGSAEAALLQDIERTVPLQDIYLRLADGAASGSSDYSATELIDRLHRLWDSGLVPESGESTLQLISRIEPFSEVADLSALISDARSRR